MIYPITDYIKSNEEKAKELGIKYQTPCHGIGDCEFEASQAALEMAEWKDKQYEYEREDLRLLADMLPIDDKN